ncbi:MAG: SpoIIE family protein phosphatase [Clostridiaceae bacterium]|jgi:stage II sporulation protein E|nr:SpoIIE family protein phosphatase [Clostridiaceae bacterium]
MRKKLNVKTILKYAVYFSLFVLLFHAETKNGLKPFALGLFVALVYSRENLLSVSPLYIVAALTADFSWQATVCAAAPALILGIAYFAHYKLKKPLSAALISFYAFLSQIPYVLLHVSGVSEALNTLLTVLVAQIFTYAAVFIVYAVKVRGLKYKLTIDEMVSGEILIAVFAIALYRYDIFGFIPFYTVAAFAILGAAFVFGGGMPVAAAALIGLGAAFAGADISIAAVLCVWAVIAVTLKSGGIYLSAAGILSADLLMGYYFMAYAEYTYLNVAAVSAGLLIFLLLPRRSKNYMLSFSGALKDTYSARTLVNRSRKDVAKRLGFLAKVFLNIREILTEEADSTGNEAGETVRLAREVSFRVCGGCASYESCRGAIGGDTSQVLEAVVENSVAAGKATMLNMPPFITSRCKKIPELIAVVNRAVQSLDGYKNARDGINEGKLMLAEQMGGISGLLSDLAFDVNKRLAFDSATEKAIIDELSYRNIVIGEAAVYGEGENLNVTLLVREGDGDKASLIKVLSKVLKREMNETNGSETVNGWQTLHFKAAPPYELTFGRAQEKRQGETVSGDTLFTGRVGDVVMLAICDGMGSGAGAMKTSVATMNLIENFYRAGFENDVIISLTNRLLSLRSSENFSTLDMLSVDLKTGNADVVKLGASDGFIKRGTRVETIDGHSLPIGILEKITPSIENIKLESGDIVILVSDGVSDALETDTLISVLEDFRSRNPQTIADELLAAAKARGLKDDATVIAARLV